eukprot:5122066-Pyramimonas_sp.AAC.2
MSFQSGYADMDPSLQTIAFWTHTIDMYYDQLWFHGTTMGAGVGVGVGRSPPPNRLPSGDDNNFDVRSGISSEH